MLLIICNILAINYFIKGKFMKFEWFLIFDYPRFRTYRANVPGGWLICSVCLTPGKPEDMPGDVSQSMVFLPDPDHVWEVEMD
jgi:hypothetical protein